MSRAPTVTPAKAGVQSHKAQCADRWIPACAGMTS